MEITGRLTGDAQVRKTKNNRELVAFTVAVNDSYKPKNGDRVDASSFFSCAYWLSTAIAKALKKSSIVTVSGHAGINAYKGSDGEFHANLTFHANHIKIIASAKSGVATAETETPVPAGSTKDDLPF